MRWTDARQRKNHEGTPRKRIGNGTGVLVASFVPRTPSTAICKPTA